MFNQVSIPVNYKKDKIKKRINKSQEKKCPKTAEQTLQSYIGG
jgi:hypothetical protein